MHHRTFTARWKLLILTPTIYDTIIDILDL